MVRVGLVFTSALGHFWVEIGAGPVHAATSSESICMFYTLLHFEGLVSLVSFIHSVSFIPTCAPIPQSSLCSDRKNFIETSHVGLTVLMSLTLLPFSGCGSLYLFLSSAGGSSDECH